MPSCKLLGKVIAKTEVNKRNQSFLFTFSLLLVGRCFLLRRWCIVLARGAAAVNIIFY
jgi:hypothetical protein